MTSTFLGYRIYAANMTQSMQRVAAEPENASDQKYFEANISKVTSVDQFVNNYRLFNYAMKAYGLQDLGNAKALMKKVLESDLTNSSSFANSLNDSRYKAFAQAFNFTSTGSVATSGSAQTTSQQNDLISKMGLPASSTAGLQATLAKVTSVSSLESNAALYSEVLSAYGLDSKTTSQSDVTAALESNLSDPLSVANRPGNAKLLSMAEDFDFASDGSIGGQKLLQSSQNMAATTTAYMNLVPTGKTAAAVAANAAALDENAYYAKTMPEITSVDQLLSDKRLTSYIEKAFGIDSTTTTAQLRSVLTSNLLDPKSAANTAGIDPKKPATTPSNFQLLASAFSIGTDGTAWDHSTVISQTNLAAITTAYTAAVGTDKKAVAAGKTETDYFNTTVPTVKSVSSLLADPRLVAYIMKAFNLPAVATPAVTTSPTASAAATTPAAPTAATTPAATTTATPASTTSAATTIPAASAATIAEISSILTSNLLDPTSVANTMGGSARQLATDFNFTASGLIYSQRPIENAANITATTTAYQNQAGTTAGAKAVAQTETAYFTSTLPRMKSVDDLLGDKRIVAYLAQAYNLPNTYTTTMRQALTSNLLDPKSAANTLGGGYQTLAAAFDISSDGTITHAAAQQAQTKTGIAATHIAYLEEAMETEAGAQNDGVRLALYFKRLAPTITDPFQILSDKALTEVVQTMLGLSSSSSNADIDSQAKNITSRINLADFKDPAKLDKLVARFSALYDIKNSSTSSSSDMVSQLFG